MASYQYESLSETSDQIRILTVHTAAEKRDVIECSLTVYDLSNVPKYRALSYVWGEIVPSCSIQLEGLQFKVTRNLHDALTTLRRSEKTVSLWVDAICIDQNTIRERNHQVKLMKNIYSLADQVVIWLGGDDEIGNLAFDMIRLWATMLSTWLESGSLDFTHTHPDAFNEIAWGAISIVLTQPWWTRIWVYQEYVLARNVLLMFGSATLHEDDFAKASVAWMETRDDRAKLGLSQRQVELLEEGIQGGRFVHLYNDHVPRSTPGAPGRTPKKGLVELQNITHDRQSTDARDKIYALLGVDEINDVTVEVDYSKSIEEVYKDFTIRCIEDQNSIEIVAFSGTGCAAVSFDAVLEMPSWVPDFRSSAVRRHGVDEVPTYADSQVRGEFCVSANKKLLSSTGIIVDVLFSTTKPDIHKSFNMDAVPAPAQSPAMHSRYPNGASRLEAIFKTITFDRSRPHISPDTYVSPAERSQVWDLLLGFSYLYGAVALRQLSEDIHEFNDVVEFIEMVRLAEAYPAKFQAWLDKLCSLVTPPGLDVHQPQSSEDVGIKYNCTLKRPHKPIELRFERIRLYGSETVTRIARMLHNRSLLGSWKGYIGLGPLHARAGDEICILFGCSTPMLLRPCGDGTRQVVGPCYVYGLMHGEAVDEWKQGRLQSTTFQLM